MTDIGNTGSQVASNVNEQEINMVREIFEKMANSLVGLSSAAKDIAEMREQLAGLKQDIEHTQARNRELDEMVAHVRRERDEAIASRAEAWEHAEKLNHSIDGLNAEATRLRNDLESTTTQLVEARRDRDDASFKNMELEEKLKERADGFDAMVIDRNYWRDRAENLGLQLETMKDTLTKAKEALGCQS